MKNMKKFLTFAMLLAFAFTSCKKDISVSGVELDHTDVIVGIGRTLTLTATVLPHDATNQGVTWTSSNGNIATVDEFGTVKGIEEGEAIITVTTHDGNRTATCRVTVTLIVDVESVELNIELDTLLIRDTLTLIATVLPEAATNKALTWTSSDTDVLSVSADGVVIPVGYGSATITVTTVDGEKTATATILVTNFCNPNTPGWGPSLGTVSFATDETWTVGRQIWSDAVQASNCSERPAAQFVGNDTVTNTFNADCRSLPGQKGDVFSWCAVYRFANVLCPAPWRVPTKQDFIDLDIALGGTGEGVRDSLLRDKYISDSYWGGRLFLINHLGNYWSQTEHGRGSAFGLSLFSNLMAGSPPNLNSWPQMPSSKATGGAALSGHLLRCVRNN